MRWGFEARRDLGAPLICFGTWRPDATSAGPLDIVRDTVIHGASSGFRRMFSFLELTEDVSDTSFDAPEETGIMSSMNRSVLFRCPSCGAKYRLTRIEALGEPTKPLACITCGGPLAAREGEFFN
jgi:predicted RNA-binding Zn-ribbon protein involved in translation (DUF1610 family)